MRPGNEAIAAPDLPKGLPWIGVEPDSMPSLTAGGPAIVHFFDFAQLNSVRTLPYLREWDRRYRSDGLRVIGVQAPRFPFGADPEVVAAGLAALEVGFPVVIDAERELWLAYGCEGWPSLFLWALGGALAWFHFGEGEYLGTEIAIQQELREADALRSLPEPPAPLRPADAPGAQVVAPSAEVFPGGDWERPWVAGERRRRAGRRIRGGWRLGHRRGRGQPLRGARRRPVASPGDRPPGHLRARHARSPRLPLGRPLPGRRDAGMVGELRSRPPLTRR